MNLETIPVAQLKIHSNPYDIRRDIHAFVDYVSKRTIKRAYRSNALPKADAKRLAKLMSNPDCLEQLQEDGTSSWWIDAIDDLARRLGFVSYDTKGSYAGYSSQSESFPDNYIQYRADVYENYLQRPLHEQEQKLYKLLLQDRSYKEFYERHLQSSLNSFPGWGSATGVVPLLKFSKIRQFLFMQLATLQSGNWYSAKAFIRYLQSNHPYFLIPPQVKLPRKNRYGRRQTMQRYENFYEYKKAMYGHDREPVPDDAPDGFERVEGRFIERFLEGIPLTLGYIDVAYSPQPYQGKMPEKGTLNAFRLHNRFFQVIREEVVVPQVKVLPNFEIHVESPIYPATLLNRLQQFANLITVDKINILKLDKQQVKAALADNDTLDPIRFLQKLTKQAVPQNVLIELEEWIGQSDVFTLYENFALLEGNKRLPETNKFVVEQISPKIRIVRQPGAVFDALEQKNRVPLHIEHAESRLKPLPTKARTIFPKKKTPVAKPKRQRKTRVTLQRKTNITLYSPTKAFYEALRAELLKQRCLFQTDQNQMTIIYAQTDKALVDAALKTLRQTYTIKLEDVQT